MHLIHDFYFWIDRVLFWGLVAVPAVDKLTKPAWLAITIIGGAIGSLFLYQPVNIISLVSLVAALVYLTDVRPAVREVSGGSR